MFFRSLRRKIKEKAEKESWEEVFRIAREWDSLSPEDKEKQSPSDYFRVRWKELDEEREARRKERERRDGEGSLIHLLYRFPYGGGDGSGIGGDGG